MAQESTVTAQEQVTYDHPFGTSEWRPAYTDDTGYHWPEWRCQWFEVGTVQFAAFGDRLLIEEDRFRSGYECPACDGTGERECTECAGTGHYKRGGREFKCSHCTQGRVKCVECEGKGGLLVVAEVSQRRPSTGKVVSVGDKVKYFEVGDNVLYSNFAGHSMDLERSGHKVVVRILHESEILAQVKGHLELRQLRNEREALGI